MMIRTENDKYLEEINRDIAISKGWKEGIYHDTAGILHWMNSDGYMYANLPQWSCYVGDAWTLAEVMANAEHFTLDSCPGDGRDGTIIMGWTCNMDDYGRTISIWAETAPLAICRCWLLWKQEAQP
jgi:hypothetical protein